MMIFLRIFLISMGMVFLIQCDSGSSSPVPLPEDRIFKVNERWVCSKNLGITVFPVNSQPVILTSGFSDFKPVWSKSGSMIVFFRLVTSNPSVSYWKTQIWVVNADGTGLRQLTSGLYGDFNPTWTRDGTNMIIFNRLDMNTGTYGAYIISPAGNIGDEVLITDLNYSEGANSGLIDGRIFIDRDTPQGMKSFLLTPNPGEVGTYQEIQRSTIYPWHKFSVSPSETRVTFMLDYDYDTGSFGDSILFYADFIIYKSSILYFILADN